MIGKPRCKLDWNMDEVINCLENIEITKIYSRRDKNSKQANNQRRKWKCIIP